MKLFKSTKVSSTALALPFVLFIWFANAADRAMDKSGMGDVAEFQRQSAFAGLFFWLDILVFTGLLLILFLKLFLDAAERTQLANLLKVYIIAAPTLLLFFLFCSFYREKCQVHNLLKSAEAE
jgi:hypothetical protein